MIITKTPFRISFVGGGSDLKEFYSKFPGAVLSTTINKYMYISSHEFFDSDQIRIKYSKTETVRDVKELEHPLVQFVLKKFQIGGAMEISSNADIPSGTGLGSSSAFTVGLLHNLYAACGRFVSRDQLAREACEIEIDHLNGPIGKQDQYSTSFGGLNIIRFNPSGSVEVDPFHLPKETHKRLQNNLLMFYTGKQRSTKDILSEQKINLESPSKVAVLKKMVELVWELRDELYAGNLFEFGRILHRNWLLKQSLASTISNDFINSLYQKGLNAGAIGGKLLGAGGGGFLLFYCEEKNHDRLRKSMNSYKELKFRFENEGTKVVHFGLEEYERLHSIKIEQTPQ